METIEVEYPKKSTSVSGIGSSHMTLGVSYLTTPVTLKAQAVNQSTNLLELKDEEGEVVFCVKPDGQVVIGKGPGGQIFITPGNPACDSFNKFV